ncbi:MAG: DUF3320 domain-containing protein [Candidatus Omnitrophota bacterium]|nr:MAG: DUF3320 domain-containing protein [Candidatus Omnitrophota bacterium]
MESILDECVASGLPQLYLKWHYRSRHESLIAFSNYHYYDNRLITFPSPQEHSPRFGVQWRYLPEALYDRAKSRTNRAEAEAVTAEIVRRLSDTEECRRSIGVVTLNMTQQLLIEDLLEEARRNHPHIDPFFSNEQSEPVFVKNLENVQGDQRDVIMLSVCYGPDQQGRLSMNFGPLNRIGGERRLNVAVTRAKEQVVVFSGLRADQIDLSRTKAVGVMHLKTYLDYAERGPRAIAEATSLNTAADFDSSFEQDVWNALTEKGWNVKTQVGCSGYRINLAVCHPQDAGRYLLGIECDGATYHRLRVARDRDRLREAVLRNLGWNIHRIWSTDWWRSRKSEIEKLESALKKALQNDVRSPSAAKPETQKSEEPKIAAIPAAPANHKNNLSQNHMEELVLPRTLPTLAGQQTYASYSAETMWGNANDFYEKKTDKSIRQALLDVVNAEGPLAYNRLLRSVAGLWGIKRITAHVEKRLESLLPPNQIVMDRTENGIFVWPLKIKPAEYEIFRVSAEDDPNSRAIDEIPPQEIGNAILAILQQQISLPKSDLIRETACCFGFKRTSENMQAIIDGVIFSLCQNKGCIEEEGNIRCTM